MLGQPMIILNSARLAFEMLDVKSTNYSDRPVLWMGGELVGWKHTLALTRYGERFREYRRFIARLIGSRPLVEKNSELTQQETRKFLRQLLKSPNNVARHIRK